MAEDFAAQNHQCDPMGQGWEFQPTFRSPLASGMNGLRRMSKPSGNALLPKHFILKAIWRNSPNTGNPTLFEI
jgi:hypothetical protein